MIRDGVEIWANPLKELIGWMQNNEDVKIIESGLEFFCNIFSKMDNRINIIVPQLMPTLF